MKKQLSILLFLSIFSAIAFGHVANAAEIIKSASELDYPPFSIVTKDGNADGFSVQLLREALNIMEYDVSFYVAPWDQIKQELADGKIQVLPVVGRTPEREKIYDFTQPYLSFYGAVFVRTGEGKDIKSEKDLSGKEIAVLKGDNAEEYVRRDKISDKIVTYPTFTEAFKALSAGKHDAIIAQEYMGRKQLESLGITNVSALPFQLSNFHQDFTFAVKKGDTKLLSVLIRGLSKVQSNGTFARLYKNWIGDEPLKDEASGQNGLYTAIVIFGGVILAGLILSRVFNK